MYLTDGFMESAEASRLLVTFDRVRQAIKKDNDKSSENFDEIWSGLDGVTREKICQLKSDDWEDEALLFAAVKIANQAIVVALEDAKSNIFFVNRRGESYASLLEKYVDAPRKKIVFVKSAIPAQREVSTELAKMLGRGGGK